MWIINITIRIAAKASGMCNYSLDNQLMEGHNTTVCRCSVVTWSWGDEGCQHCVFEHSLLEQNDAFYFLVQHVTVGEHIYKSASSQAGCCHHCDNKVFRPPPLPPLLPLPSPPAATLLPSTRRRVRRKE